MTLEVPILQANTFYGVMESGYSKALRLKCGNEKTTGDYIVKLENDLYSKRVGLISELISYIIAKKIGVTIPDIALINIDDEFCNSVTDIDVKNRLLQNKGMNFGSKILTGGFVKLRTKDLRSLSSADNLIKIFVFDMIICNYDRIENNSNMLTNGKEIFVIDHELAFAFLLKGNKCIEPFWRLSISPNYLRKHFFHDILVLNGPNHNITNDMISRLDSELAKECLDSRTTAWDHDQINDIYNYIDDLVNNKENFETELKNLLK